MLGKVGKSKPVASDEDMGPDYDGASALDNAEEENEGYTAAGQEIIDAVGSGDPDAVAKAVRGIIAQYNADK